MIHFTIQGRIPSKKNSRNLFTRGNRIINIPSQKYKEWHDDASMQVTAQARKNNLTATIDEVSLLQIQIYAPDKRESDISNKVESINDLLVDNGILKDDNWFVVPRLDLQFCGVDRENPRAEILIYR